MNIETFNALHMPALEREEARHSLILSLMARAAKEDPPGQTRLWSFGEPGACALQTPGRGLVLGALGRADCEAFADEMGGTPFRSVLGSGDTAAWFAARAAAHGETFAEPMRQRILAITGAPIWPQTSGQARPVAAADIDLYADWAHAFIEEAIPEDSAPERSELERQVASGNFLFWTVDGEPVSLAGAIRRTRPAFKNPLPTGGFGSARKIDPSTSSAIPGRTPSV